MPKRSMNIGWKVSMLTSSVASVRYRALLPMLALESEQVRNRLFSSGLESNCDVQATHADIIKLQEWVGFSPNTPLQEGIEKFVAWYHSIYEPSNLKKRAG